MKQEDKELLLKDLCARLPYSTLCYCKWTKDAPNGTSGCVQEVSTYLLDELMVIDDRNYESQICEIKPYLRPMSSMTEEEISVLSLCNAFIEPRSIELKIDFYNKQHLDYRGLISKGLAIEVTEENNPYK